jgi:hypothetical protein
MSRKQSVLSLPPRPSPPVARCHLESLETRTLYSFSVDPAGQLFVWGTYARNEETVWYDGRGTPDPTDDLVRAFQRFYDGTYIHGQWPAAQISRAVLSGGHEKDTLQASCPFPTAVYGYEGDDIIRSTWGQAYLSGGPGNDNIGGGISLDVLYGGDGDDVMNGGDGPDILYGEAGDDVLHGNGGDDHLHGGDDNDQLFGDAGVDRLYGDNGNDRLDTGADSNSGEIAYGGNGFDLFKYRSGDTTDRLFTEILY